MVRANHAYQILTTGMIGGMGICGGSDHPILNNVLKGYDGDPLVCETLNKRGTGGLLLGTICFKTSELQISLISGIDSWNE